MFKLYIRKIVFSVVSKLELINVKLVSKIFVLNQPYLLECKVTWVKINDRNNLVFIYLFIGGGAHGNFVRASKSLTGPVEKKSLALSPAFDLKNGNLMLTLLSVTINHPLVHNTHRCPTPCRSQLSHSGWMKQTLICHFSYEWMLALGSLFVFILFFFKGKFQVQCKL